MKLKLQICDRASVSSNNQIEKQVFDVQDIFLNSILPHGTRNNISFWTNSFAKKGSSISKTTLNPFQSGSSQIGIIQTPSTQVSSTQVSSTQVSTLKNTLIKNGLPQVSSTQVSSTQVSSTQVGRREISNAFGILSQNSFYIHNSIPEIINDLNNSATNIWSNLLQSETQLDINFQITDLLKGQLVKTAIAGFDASGKPNAGTILIDRDTNNVDWFIID